MKRRLVRRLLLHDVRGLDSREKRAAGASLQRDAIQRVAEEFGFGQRQAVELVVSKVPEVLVLRFGQRQHAVFVVIVEARHQQVPLDAGRIVKVVRVTQVGEQCLAPPAAIGIVRTRKGDQVESVTPHGLALLAFALQRPAVHPAIAA